MSPFQTLPVLALLTLLALSGCAQAAPTSRAQDIPLKEIQTFSEVYSIIRADYVDPTTATKLMNGAIAGMVHSLDPHSAYLTPKERKEMESVTDGRFGGLGLEVTDDQGLLRVIAPIDGSPAARAGIQANDLIIKINGKSVQGMGLQRAVDQMRGKTGSEVTLTLLRPHQTAPLTLTLTRAIIHIQSVHAQLLAPGYGYLRISLFQDNTGHAVEQALNGLERENHGPLRGLILDLRNNPGGVLQAGVETANAFLSHGLIVYTQGRVADSDMRFTAHGPDRLHGAPLIVLINGGSASAAEIVTGALKDDHRALIMGSRSFGKGSVQTVIPLSNGGAIKLTTALYYTPNGCSIQSEGIIPNVAVRPANEASRALDEDLLKESELRGVLKAPQPCHQVQPSAVILEPKAATTSTDAAVAADPAQGFLVHEALKILEGKPVQVQHAGQTTATVIPLPGGTASVSPSLKKAS